MKQVYSKAILLIIICCSLFATQKSEAQNWQWAKAGVGNLDEYGESVVTDAEGNIYVCGTFNSSSFSFGATTLVNPGCPYVGEACDVVYLLKCDPNGNLLWMKTAAGSGEARSLAYDHNGNIYMAGHFYSTAITFGTTTLTNDSDNTYDIFLVKYDNNGNVIWAKSAGGTDYDFVTAVQADRAGNAYLSGYFNSASITFGSTVLGNDSVGTGNIFFAKYDTHGNAVWAKGAGGKKEDEATGLTTDGDDNVYVTGYFNSPYIVFGADTLHNGGDHQNMFVVKCDASGNVIWVHDPGVNSNIKPTSISTDLYGSVYVTGSYWGYTADFGPFTLTNSDTSYMGNNYALFLARYNTAGNIKWVKGASGGLDPQASCVTNDPAGYVYMAGTSIFGDLAFGTDTITDCDIFLVKYDSLSNVMWTTNAHGNFPADYPACITSDGAGSLYMTGNFGSWVMHFGSTTLTDTNNYYMFLAKLGTANLSVPLVTQDLNVMLYPNPATSTLTISASGNINTLAISNLLGQTLFTQACAERKIEIDVANLPAGVYFVRINDEVRKFIKL